VSLLSLSLGDLDFETDSQDIEVIKDVAANIYLGMSFAKAVVAFMCLMLHSPFESRGRNYFFHH
jgi:hypothetical protein